MPNENNSVEYLLNEIDKWKDMASLYSRSWVFHRPEKMLNDSYGMALPNGSVDSIYILRCCNYYNIVTNTEIGNNFWVENFGKLNLNIHNNLLEKNVVGVQAQLSDPSSTALFTGFDTLTISRPDSGEWYKYEAKWTYDNLLALLEAVGVRRILHVESFDPQNPVLIDDVDSLLSQLDNALGIFVDFPNIYPNEIGLMSSRGIISYRAIQAVYQGWRIAKLASENALSHREYSVIEIGGGLGRTAFYAIKFGIKKYTIVDIPLTSVAQAHFLGVTLGPEHIKLWGENNSIATDFSVNLLPPVAFFEDDSPVDLIVNIDSFPEIHENVVIDYLKKIKTRSNKFLTINHETLAPFTVHELAIRYKLRSEYRFPYWLRRGYVEELFSF